MRSTEGRGQLALRRLRWDLAAVVLALLLCAGMLLSAAAPERHLAVYSAAANYSLPIVRREGQDYVGVIELLDPLGAVSAKDAPPRWQLRFNNISGEFSAGSSRVRLQGRYLDFPGKFLVENGRGLAPLASLSSLIPRFLYGPVTLREESDRLFIGNIATHFTASIQADDPSRLVFRFSAPVNPTLASEPGTLRMTFRRDPVTSPASPMLTFDSKVIPSADYSESDGSAQIVVNTTVPLIASFSPDARTITLSAAKVQVAARANPANPEPAAQVSKAAAPVQPAATASGASGSRRYFAVLDASHGGNDRGEALSASLAEKDVTLALARRLRQELESRGITSFVLRDSDVSLSQDERATFANVNHAAVYIALHAASNGHGVRLYTALMPGTGSEDIGPFRAWSSAQSSFLPISQATAASVASELWKLKVTTRALSAPLRPLNNVVSAAIVVELAPPASEVSALTAPDYQQLIAGAVANGIALMRWQLGAAP